MWLRKFFPSRRAVIAVSTFVATVLAFAALNSYLARRERQEAFAEADRLDPCWR